MADPGGTALGVAPAPGAAAALRHRVLRRHEGRRDRALVPIERRRSTIDLQSPLPARLREKLGSSSSPSGAPISSGRFHVRPRHGVFLDHPRRSDLRPLDDDRATALRPARAAAADARWVQTLAMFLPFQWAFYFPIECPGRRSLVGGAAARPWRAAALDPDRARPSASSGGLPFDGTRRSGIEARRSRLLVVSSRSAC